jgi:UDP:flavonoid glycosyltransferase YjiC (YdhE family)
VSKRVVLACWGSYGDLFPYLRIAIRLKALGHEPVLVTCAYYRDLVERAAIEFHPLSPDVDPTDNALLSRVMDPARGTEVIVRELLVPNTRRAFAEIAGALDGADLLVSHPVTFAAPLVGGSRRMKWIATALAPASFFSAYDFPLLPPHPEVMRLARIAPSLARGFMKIAAGVTGGWTAPIREFRRELGLSDRGDPLYAGQFSPHGNLALFSPVFGAPQQDWPARTSATGFVFDPADAPLDPELDAFLAEGEAPIVFTLGSSAVGAAGSFYEESAAAAIRLGRRAILLVGRDPRNRSTRPLPPGIIAIEYAPHAPLFRRAAVVVHHGGIGTTAEALRSGRPMLVVPHAHDQPDNAFRAARLGVARWIDARRFSAAGAARQLETLLTGRYAGRAAHLGRAIAAEDGVGRACDEILEHAR